MSSFYEKRGNREADSVDFTKRRQGGRESTHPQYLLTTLAAIASICLKEHIDRGVSYNITRL